MSYLTPFILLYIIDQHKPKPLDNPEKNLIIFKTPTIGGRGRRDPYPLLEGHTVRYDEVVQIKTACKVSPADGQRKESVLL